MPSLKEVVEDSRTGVDRGSRHEDKRDSINKSKGKQKQSRKRRSSSRSQDLSQASLSGHISEEEQKESVSGGQNVQQQPDSKEQDAAPTQEDYRTQFYDKYREEAEGYDKDFLKRYGEDLDTTLIFAGLFSAVASAFIIDVNSQLQPDPGDETAALLRVLIYEMNPTVFGDNVPTLPQWTGPPRAIVDVQAILFASLTASLFSAFLAMLGKQWLNRYSSTNVRGTAIERSQNRQRKLDGVIAWYFDYVLESLPLMLQGALLLLGCALSRYLWEVNITIAAVVFGVTSFGALFYGFIVIAGTISESCPYQTPVARILRQIPIHYIPSTFRSTRSSDFVQKSWCLSFVVNKWWPAVKHPEWSDIIPILILTIPMLLIASAIDIYRLGRVTPRSLIALSKRTYHRSLAPLFRTAYRWFTVTSPQTDSLDKETIVLDVHCVSWMLQTSLDKAVRLLSFNHLISMPELGKFDPALAVECFNTLNGCISISDGKVVVMRGLEDLATVAARGLCRTLYLLKAMDPTSSVLVDVRRCFFDRGEPIDFSHVPFGFTMNLIVDLVGRYWSPPGILLDEHQPHSQKYIPLAQWMVEAARLGYQQTQGRKVPRWILRFALDSLSQDRCPTTVISSCLSIIAIDLGCDVANIDASDGSERIKQISTLIIKKLVTMTEPDNPRTIFSKRKAISALLPYTICLGRNPWMATIISRAVVASNSAGFVWRRIGEYIDTLFDEPKPPFLNLVITLMSPFVSWSNLQHDENAVERWKTAALEAWNTEAVGYSAVDALLQIAYNKSLRSHIPVELWERMKNQRTLPPYCKGTEYRTHSDVVPFIQQLGDVEILKSYFLLIWSEWGGPDNSGSRAMEISIRKKFGGDGMQHHREQLIERLDHVLRELDRGIEHFRQPALNRLHYSLFRSVVDEFDIQDRKEKYRQLKRVLLEVGGEDRPTNTRHRSTFTCSLFSRFRDPRI